jgi:hypothetical protein
VEHQNCEWEEKMKKGQLVGGIICLALAALLAVLNWRLPAEKLIFTVGGINIPMIILAVVGLVLVATAWRRQSA